MGRRGRAALVLVLALGLAAGFVGCGEDAEVAGNDDGFGSGGAAGGSGGSGGASGDAAGDALIGFDQGGGDQGGDCPGGCPEGQVCSNGVCVTQTQCGDDDECQNDTHCDPAVGCIPWQPGEFDPGCQVGLPAGNFAPAVKCEFAAPPAGDPFPSHTDVQATPSVVNFNAPGAGVPSIVALFTAPVPGSYTETQGIVRVLRGDDCSLEANLGMGHGGYAGWLRSSSSVALGDLDGDGIAEIVARTADDHLVAFKRTGGAWGTLWVSAGVVGGGGWAGPSIHELDDDATPEVIQEGAVVDGLTGATRSGQPPGYASHSQGLDPVLANLDQDPAIELTNGASVWEWNGAAWAAEAWFPAAAAGFPAVADFGAYGPGPADTPEIVVVRDGSVTIYASDGTAALATTTIPGPGGGGPPTIADYDGDGLAEVGVAAEAFLTVFDIDCTGAPRNGGTCAAGQACDDMASVPGPCAAGVLWSRRTQDMSSNITGSSVFDFEDDGVAEVVYADECFVRVYSGTGGEVLFSQYRSSCTWYENPIVADTDGNFRADLVTPSNLACSPVALEGIGCTMLDPSSQVDIQFAGLRCLDATDCVSGACDQGFCRCTTTAECCAAATDPDCLEQGFTCAAPPAGTPGSGNTCRAAHPHGVTGIRVYNDANDSWVRSRTIWSQHAYHVTHVNEDGTVPQRSQWQKNWTDPTLNNFRQNVPGVANGLATPDMTAGASEFTCSGGVANLTAPVCNRGAEPIGSGVVVGFFDGTTLACEAVTTKPLQPGECETVSCQWADPPPSAPGVDITVVADPTDDKNECKEGNNQGAIAGVACKPPS